MASLALGTTLEFLITATSRGPTDHLLPTQRLWPWGPLALLSFLWGVLETSGRLLKQPSLTTLNK